MKQALSPEVPARVRRGQFRAITLGIGASALAMACSFGSVDEDPDIQGDLNPGDDGSGEPIATPDDTDDGKTVNGGNQGGGDDVDTNTPPPTGGKDIITEFNPDDPFSSEEGAIVKDILETNCGTCHIGPGSQGDFGYLLNIDELITSNKVIPGSKEDSQLYNRMVGGTMPPAAVRVIQTPTYGQIELVGKWIDELELPDPEGTCEPVAFRSVDDQIQLMAGHREPGPGHRGALHALHDGHLQQQRRRLRPRAGSSALCSLQGHQQRLHGNASGAAGSDRRGRDDLPDRHP